MSSRHLTAGLVVASLALTACGGGGTSPDADPPASSASPTAAATGTADYFWSEYDAIVDRPSVDPETVPVPKAPQPFTRADVETMARDALTILLRGSSPVVSTMGKRAAVDYVVAEEPANTTKPWVQGFDKAFKGKDWQGVAASRFQAKPSEPTWLKVVYRVRSKRSQLDGRPAPVLSVDVQGVAVQRVAADGAERPVLVRRTVTLNNFRPRDPSFWPGLGVAVQVPTGIDQCAFFDGALLVPKATEGDEQDVALRNLRAVVDAKGFDTRTRYGKTDRSADDC